MKGEVTYNGLELEAETAEDVKDLKIIIGILNKHKILVGGYEMDEQKPDLNRRGDIVYLDLGR